MLYVKAFHLIALVAWFAGLFYLPRLFVYHVDATDEVSLNRFDIMERRLYFGIMWPAAVLATGLGIWLLMSAPGYYLKAGWMHAKIGLVVLLWVFHLYCGHCRKKFILKNQSHTAKFYRILNELPTLLLIAIVILVVVKPF